MLRDRGRANPTYALHLLQHTVGWVSTAPTSRHRLTANSVRNPTISDTNVGLRAEQSAIHDPERGARANPIYALTGSLAAKPPNARRNSHGTEHVEDRKAP